MDTIGEVQGGRRKSRRWLKVLLVLAGLALLGIAAFRMSEGSLDAQLEAKLEGYRRAGQPATLADLKPAPVDPSDNAAEAIQQASALLKLDERQEFVAQRPDPRWVQQEPELINALLAANAEPIRLAHQAAGMKGVDWGLDYADPITSAIGLRLHSKSKNGCYLLATAAHWEAQKGQDTESIARVLDVLGISRASYDPPLLVSDLVCLAEASLACKTIEGALPYWDLKDPQARQATMELMQQLLDEKGFFAMGQRVWWGERAWLVSFVATEYTRPAGMRPSVMSIVQGPLMRADLLKIMDDATQTAKACALPTWPQAQAHMPPPSGSAGAVKRFLHPLSAMGPDSRAISLQLRYQSLARRRLAATALAMALYQADHGRPVEKLSELVPDYLPALLDDPFSASGELLKLASTGLARLYSVNVDGVDQGGTDNYGPDGKGSFDSDDVVFYLAGDRPMRPLEPIPDPTSQPTDAELLEGAPRE
jgi:hypothetical protein